jgi:hypothetical protein
MDRKLRCLLSGGLGLSLSRARRQRHQHQQSHHGQRSDLYRAADHRSIFFARFFGVRGFLGHVFEKFAGLAIQGFADGFQRGEPHASDMARFQQRQVRLRDTDGLGQFVRAHLAFGHHHIETDDDGHQMNSLRSASA